MMYNYLAEIIEAKWLEDYKIVFTFDNGVQKIVDLKDSLNGPMYEPLLNVEFFKNFALNKEIGTIVWPNGADVAPDNMYEIGTTINKSQ